MNDDIALSPSSTTTDPVYLAVPGQSNREDPPTAAFDGSQPLPESRHDLHILQSLRRIFRAADLFSRQLAKRHRVTTPQLMCLHKILQADGLTVSQLSREIYLSASTVVGILDRLEREGLVQRRRSASDRRKVLIHATAAGRDLVEAAPSPLQRAIERGLASESESRRAEIAECLRALVKMLEAEDLDAAPMLETAGAIADADYYPDTLAHDADASSSSAAAEGTTPHGG